MAIIVRSRRYLQIGRRSLSTNCVKAKEQISQRIRDNRRIRTVKIASEMSLIKWKKRFKILFWRNRENYR